MVLKILYLLSVLVIGAKFATAENHPVITTPSGKIEGNTLTSRLGKTIYAFRGIRFAEPPVGDLRFEPPVPIESWKGVYNATEDGLPCIQPVGSGSTSEDCLILNVYSTKLPTRTDNPKRPVIVFIPPGGFFFFGTISTWVGPQYFMDKDVVLVSIQYRLATLGFLSTGDKYAPGNNAMKDQVVALKWIKKNIESFGGDPQSITLLGYSAGGWSIILHMLSPLSQGLFHKGIVMSGTPVGTWPIPTGQLDVAKKQARLVGCPDDTSENIVKCLKTVPAEKFADSLSQFAEFGPYINLVWSPVVEGNFSTSRFLTENPIRQMMQGRFQKIPIVIGQTKDEFGYAAITLIDNKTLTDEFNNDFDRVAPITFNYVRDNEESKKISRAIRSFYLKDKPADKSQLSNLEKLYTDGVGFAAHRAAKLLAQYGNQPVYRYTFNFRGTYSHYYYPGTNKTYGVVHHDDLIYLFYLQASFPRFTRDSPKPDIYMVDKLTTLYSNFAKTGKPIPEPCGKLNFVEWVPFTLRDQKYMIIDNTLEMKEKIARRSFCFLGKIVSPKYVPIKSNTFLLINI